jgi:L-rhamnose mutarotase
MKRAAFKMMLKPGATEEYKRRHDEIWPELVATLEQSGISDYAIWLDEATGILFACQKLKDHNQSDRLSEQPIIKKWWAYMSDLMETNPDLSPICIDLAPMFYMD